MSWCTGQIPDKLFRIYWKKSVITFPSLPLKSRSTINPLNLQRKLDNIQLIMGNLQIHQLLLYKIYHDADLMNDSISE